MFAFGTAAVGHDQRGVGTEHAAEPEPEVHRHADHHRHVGVPQCLTARPGERQIVIGRHHSTGHPVHQHRNPQRLSQFQQFGLGVSPPHTGARHDHRTLRLREQVDGARKRLPVGGVGGRQGVQRPGRLGVGSESEHDIHREIDERHTRRCADGGPQCVVDHRRYRFRRGRGGGVAGQGRHERDVVDLLQRAHPPAHRGGAPAEHQHR